MIAMVGFRNVAIHEYQMLDMEVLRSIATNGWRSLVRYLEELGLRIHPERVDVEVSTQTIATTLHHTLGVPASPSRSSRSAVGLSALIGAPSAPQYRFDPSRAPYYHLAGAGGALRALLAAVLLLVASVGAWGATITWTGPATGDREVNTVPRQNAFPGRDSLLAHRLSIKRKLSLAPGGMGTDSDGLFAKTRFQGAILFYKKPYKTFEANRF